MSKLGMLWISLGLSAVAFLLIWLGVLLEPALMWLGMLLFLAAMLLAPATRYLGDEVERHRPREPRG